MPDQVYCFSGMTPLEGLELLSGLASGPEGADVLRAVKLVINHLPNLNLTDVALALPQNRRQLLPRIQEVVGEQVGFEVQPWPAGQRYEAAEGAARLLWATSTRDVNAPPGEYLLVGRDLGAEQVRDLLGPLRIHATGVRLSIAGNEQGSSYTLFWLRDDPARASTFSSMIASARLNGWPLLTGRPSAEGLVFLEEDLSPHPDALASFAHLLRAVPSYFAAGPARGHAALAALVPVDEENQDLLYLASLPFHDGATLGSPPGKEPAIHVGALGESAGKMEEVRRVIEASPDGGYRLELLSSPYHYDDTAEARASQFQELYDERDRLDYRIHYLESIAPPPPLLLRFTTKQLPALADYIGNLPGEALRNRHLLYGFHNGHHFLFIDQEYSQVRQPYLDPLLQWSYLDDQVMRYTLDPFWYKYYGPQQNRHYLFVPEHTSLFPPVHDWNVEPGAMDIHLRQIVGQWLEAAGLSIELPRWPLYLVESTPGEHSKIQIRVLDRTLFTPLDVRLGWLNRNLLLLQEAPLAEWIEEMASHAEREALARQMETEAEQVLARLEQTSLSIRQEAASRTGELTRALTSRLADMANSAEEQQKGAQQLNERVRQLGTRHDAFQQLVLATESAYQQIESSGPRLRAHLSKLEKELTALLQKAQEIRSRADSEAREMIDRLARRRQALMRELLSLNLWGHYDR